MLSFRTIVLASAIGLALGAAPALADTVNYTATLQGSMETPPNDSTGTGKADVTYDTASKMLSWNITYQGLTGDATAAHFHGPAAVGANAAPVVPIKGSLASPIKGMATLTDAQAKDLEAGMWYFNVHSAKYPDGEIRGQVVKAQ